MTAGADSPIFLVGMPRSGTTVTFQALAAHERVAWLSQLNVRAPRVTQLALLSRLPALVPRLAKSASPTDRRRWLRERLTIGPSEAYEVWERCCGRKFLFDYLLGVEANDRERACVRGVVRDVLRYGGGERFIAKLTGPARIGYLTSIFPKARFVHVIRDGRAVARSLMGVAFWREGSRMTSPAWEGGLAQDRLQDWSSAGASPLALAAIQWDAVIRTAREEAAAHAPKRYAEIRYEDFVSEPRTVIDEITRFAELPTSARMHRFLDQRAGLRDMNYRWREELGRDELLMLDELIGSRLAELGYQPGGEVGDAWPLHAPFMSGAAA